MKNESELFRTKWLGWVLNLPFNLKRSSPEELRQLKAESLFFCSSLFRLHNEKSFFKRLTPERYEEQQNEVDLTRLKNALSPAIRFIWKFSSPADDGIPPGGKKSVRISPNFKWYEDEDLPLNDVSIELMVDFQDETQSFQVNYSTNNYLTRAQMNLSRLIEDFPSGSIIKCKGCPKYFIDTTLKKRKFCNSLCAARYISKNKREDMQLNHPRRYQRYLKDQRERMRLRRMKEK
jgi:hypothetical protein